MMQLPSGVSSPYGQILKGYLPAMYTASTIMDVILQAHGTQFDGLYLALNSILQQAFVLTATEWGLSIWETELGLSTVTPADLSRIPRDGSATPAQLAPSLSIAERQARILFLLCGATTPTIAAITNACLSYQDGQVDVYEDIPNYKVYVLFTSQHGIPPNVATLEAGIRAVVPAHLDLAFVFGRLTWGVLGAHNWTWTYIASQGWTWAQLAQQG